MIAVNANTHLSLAKRLPLTLHKAALSAEQKKEFIIEKIDNRSLNVTTKISVVIVAHNEKDNLPELLDRLESQKKSWAEIILVDNGLIEPIARTLRQRNILYIKTTHNLGCCGGRNLGATLATGDILLFIDADGRIDNYLLENTANTMKGDIQAIRGRIIPKNKDLLAHLTPPAHYDLGNEPFPHQTNAEGISAWNAKFFKLAGGFEETLHGYEGPVLNYRMHELFAIPSSSFIYSPNLILHHDYSIDKKHLDKKNRDRIIQESLIHIRYPLLQNFILQYRNSMPVYPATHGHSQTEQAKQKIRRKIRKQNAVGQILQAECNPEARIAPAFSVVIPCYNLGRFLPNCLQSVKSQTLNPIEIIIVDDASTDPHTINVLDTLDSSVKVIRLPENMGVAHARNVGIENAQSGLILCLDADDTISETYLEKAFNVFEISEEIGMVSTWVKMHGERNSIWKPKDKPRLADCLTTSPLPTATCFRKSAWKATGNGFDPSLRGYEDWDFWLSILEKGYMARVIPSINFYYYTRPDSKVGISNKNSFALTKKIVENHISLYRENIVEVVAQQNAKNIQLKHKLKKMEKRGKLERILLRAGIRK